MDDDVQLVRFVEAISPTNDETPRAPLLQRPMEMEASGEERLSLFDAAQLLDRLHAIKMQGHLSEAEMIRIKTQILDQTFGGQLLDGGSGCCVPLTSSPTIPVHPRSSRQWRFEAA